MIIKFIILGERYRLTVIRVRSSGVVPHFYCFFFSVVETFTFNFIFTSWKKEGKFMEFYNLSAGNDNNKLSLSPLFRRAIKCSIIILPSLLLSSAAFAKEVPAAAKGTKETVRATEAGRRLAKSKKAMDAYNKTSGKLLTGTICTGAGATAAKGVVGPISKTTAIAGFIATLLCGAVVTASLLED